MLPLMLPVFFVFVNPLFPLVPPYTQGKSWLPHMDSNHDKMIQNHTTDL